MKKPDEEKAAMVICQLPEQEPPGERGLAVCFNKTACKQFLLDRNKTQYLGGRHLIKVVATFPSSSITHS